MSYENINSKSNHKSNTKPKPAYQAIKKLPDDLINQIAAGEVIDRPSGVVKELIENSLDAGALRIEIYLKEGGMEEILIIDDGHGIRRDELTIAVERHATSKLRMFDDLSNLSTLGFRGEALSSIASVSNIEIISRTKESDVAHQLSVNYGQLDLELRPKSGPVGTTIRVKQLFSQIPARQKFLRSPATEFSHCARIVRELALGNAATAFSLHHQGRLINSYAVASRISRFKQCMRPTWNPIEIIEEGGEVALHAILSPPSLAQDRGDVFFYVNGRAVKNKGLVAAVRNTYKNLLGPHREPSGVIFIDLRRDWLDVNVHPQKLEVRFLKTETIYGWLASVLRKGVESKMVPTQKAPVLTKEPQFYEQFLDRYLKIDTKPKADSLPYEVYRPQNQSTANFLNPSPDSFIAPKPDGLIDDGSSETPETPIHNEKSISFWQLGGSHYWVGSEPDGLLVVDLKSLMVEDAFLQLKLEWGHGQLYSKELDEPVLIRLSRENLNLVDNFSKELERLGFRLEPFADLDLVIQACPGSLPKACAAKTVLELLTALSRDQNSTKEFLYDEALLCLAQHIADSRDCSLNTLQSLWSKMSQTTTDPANRRNVCFRLSFLEIKKRFESN